MTEVQAYEPTAPPILSHCRKPRSGGCTTLMFFSLESKNRHVLWFSRSDHTRVYKITSGTYFREVGSYLISPIFEKSESTYFTEQSIADV